jgi:hypothetical protein
LDKTSTVPLAFVKSNLFSLDCGVSLALKFSTFKDEVCTYSTEEDTSILIGSDT